MTFGAMYNQYLIWPDDTVIAQEDYDPEEYGFRGDDYAIVWGSSPDDALEKFKDCPA